jgi:hypothetical protein
MVSPRGLKNLKTALERLELAQRKRERGGRARREPLSTNRKHGARWTTTWH